MARHASPRTPTGRRALAALATAGVALGVGAATAAAAEAPVPVGSEPTSIGELDPQAGTQAVSDSVGHVTGSATGVRPNPLAGTGADPLDNGVGTQVADFQPLDSRAVTRPVAQAESIGALPVVGQVTGPLGG
ncbi:hypothetical protein ACGFNV_09535 [Streptomyces sp. NPDC048751]|uniref:hypothetical protein n=1 Tax=Streptomyces sp. NPDC048751 TaxID=3365591 RepID=UPI003711ED1C